MEIITNPDKIKWDELLKRSPFSSPFQTPSFFEIYNSSDGFSADVFAVEDENVYKTLAVVTIQKEKGLKGFLSIRGVIYGGPLMTSEGSLFLEYLLNRIKSFYQKKLIFLEIRNHFDYSSNLHVFQNAGWNYEPHLNVQLKIKNEDIDSILGRMKYNRRREINQSYKEGAITRIANSLKEVEDLYEILKDLYDNRVKLPLNPFSFFANLYKSDIGRVIVVEHKGEIIGGAFCMYLKNHSINTMYYAGLRSYHKKIFPTHLAIVDVINFAIENNLAIVDFMGAGKPGVAYGVRNYKLQFGGDLVEHGRYGIIFKPLLYKLGVWGLKLLAKKKVTS